MMCSNNLYRLFYKDLSHLTSWESFHHTFFHPWDFLNTTFQKLLLSFVPSTNFSSLCMMLYGNSVTIVPRGVSQQLVSFSLQNYLKELIFFLSSISWEPFHCRCFPSSIVSLIFQQHYISKACPGSNFSSLRCTCMKNVDINPLYPMRYLSCSRSRALFSLISWQHFRYRYFLHLQRHHVSPVKETRKFSTSGLKMSRLVWTLLYHRIEHIISAIKRIFAYLACRRIWRCPGRPGTNPRSGRDATRTRSRWFRTWGRWILRCSCRRSFPECWRTFRRVRRVNLQRKRQRFWGESGGTTYNIAI